MLKRWILATSLACAIAVAANPATAQTASVTLRFGNGHTFWVDGNPNLALVPSSTVYYYGTAPDYDLYRFGDTYFVNNGSSWYASSTLGGPYTRVNFNKIPREVTVVPVDYRRYEMRPNGKDPWVSRWRVEKGKAKY